MSRDNEKIISSEISHWVEILPDLQDYFNSDIITGLLKVVSIMVNTDDEKIDKTILSRFVSGLALIPIYNTIRDPEILKVINRFAKPIITMVISWLKSPEFQSDLIRTEVTGTGKYRPSDDTEFLISIDELLLHGKKTGAFLLNRSDVVSLEHNWRSYLKSKYRINHDNCAQPKGDKLTLPQIALKLVYNRVLLQHPDSDKNNSAKNIAAEHGFNAGTSGVQLYRHWKRFWKAPNERTGVEGKKNINERIKDINKILPFLGDKTEATQDLKSLNNKL